MLHKIANKWYWFLGGYLFGGIVGYFVYYDLEGIVVLGMIGALGMVCGSFVPVGKRPSRGRIQKGPNRKASH
jgi:hypothetical protein